MSTLKIKYVYLVHKKYWRFRPKQAGEFKDCNFPVDRNGFHMPPIRLGTIEDSEDQIIRAYQAAKQSLMSQAAFEKRQLGYIAKQYFNSEEFKSKATSTQTMYKNASVVLQHPMEISEEDTTLARLCVEDITKPIINSIRHKRMQEYQDAGKSGVVIINRQVAWLSIMIKWGLNNIPELPQINNPLIGIDKFKETKNTRYVTNEELSIQCKEAEYIVDWLPAFIEFTYRIGSRGSETCDIRESHLKDEGVEVPRRKGSKVNIIKWTPHLKKLVQQAQQLRNSRKGNVTEIDPPLFTNTSGDKISPAAIQSAMGRLKKRMNANGQAEIFFSLHKTKSKAQSDSQDDNISGLSSQMKDRYNTKKHIIDTGIE